MANDLPSTCDVVVIGGGIIGTCTALYLARKGVSVVLCEKGEIAGEQTIVLELRVAKGDLGKVIGKQGRTVKAMRSILSAASSKLRKRADLEILE